MNYEKRDTIIRAIEDLVDADADMKCRELRSSYWDDSRYLTVEIYSTGEDIALRFSNHKQVGGGGYRIVNGDCGNYGERCGESDLSINLHGDRRQAKAVVAQVWNFITSKRKEGGTD